MTIMNIRSLGRRFAVRWSASMHMTAQQRADAYVARSPIAVIVG